MPSRIVLLASVVATAAATAGVLGAAALEAAPARVDAGSRACARTNDAAAPALPSPGVSCWVDVDPYPFGSDGDPVDTTSPTCRPPAPPWKGVGDPLSCYLKVDSLAFRAWNRGLAATSPISQNASASTAFGVWSFNGTRWFPDPTFPGQTVCQGNRVLWAGKRDYWLVGTRATAWPSLCRFDGVNVEWQPLEVPRATLDRVPLDANGRRRGGAITSGACFAWNDCWFFGSFGVVVHWDGNALSDASPDLRAQPWLGGEYTAAVARTDQTGRPFGFAVTTTGGFDKGQQLPPQPDGTPPPQVYRSTGGAFSPLGYSPPSAPEAGDPYRTDLVGADFDPQGNGWIAGDPTGFRAGFNTGTRRNATSSQPAPLLRLTPDGTAAPCGGYDANRFRYTFGDVATGSDAYLWSSISVFPGTGNALAGAQFRPAAAGANVNDDGRPEPALVVAACDRAPTVTRFRVPDPFSADPANAKLIPADRTGWMTSVAANAVNDAWASSTSGALVSPADPSAQLSQRPHLYRLTDGQPPLALAGDDDESRPLVFEPDPPIFVEEPPEPDPPALPDTTVTQAGPTTTKRITLKPAIYGMKKPTVRTGKGGTIFLDLSFKVRRPVTMGVQALRRRTIVSSSGLKHLKPPRGKLVLKLDRRHWPTRIRFVAPRPAPHPRTVPKVLGPRGPQR